MVQTTSNTSPGCLPSCKAEEECVALTRAGQGRAGLSTSLTAPAPVLGKGFSHCLEQICPGVGSNSAHFALWEQL